MDLTFIQSEIHRLLLQQILDEADGDKEVIGVLLKGSVARGDAYPGSDLDVHVLLKDGCTRAFSSEERRGTLVECTYIDYPRARSKLERDPMHVYAYLDGRILYDPTGRLQELTDVARARFQTYRVSAKEKRKIAHWLKSAHIKIAAAQDAGDELRAAYVTGVTSWVILEGIWAVHEKPVPPCGAVWAHIQDLSPETPNIEAWLRRLFGEDASDRIQAAVEIIAWVVLILES